MFDSSRNPNRSPLAKYSTAELRTELAKREAGPAKDYSYRNYYMAIGKEQDDCFLGRHPDDLITDVNGISYVLMKETEEMRLRRLSRRAEIKTEWEGYKISFYEDHQLVAEYTVTDGALAFDIAEEWEVDDVINVWTPACFLGHNAMPISCFI